MSSVLTLLQASATSTIPKAIDTAAVVAAACVGIDITNHPVDAPDDKDNDIDDDHQASAASTIAKVAAPGLDFSAAVSSANDDVPNEVDFCAPAKGSTNCLRHAAGVSTFMSMPDATPTSSMTYLRIIINIWSLTAVGPASLVHASLGALQAFDGMPQSLANIHVVSMSVLLACAPKSFLVAATKSSPLFLLKSFITIKLDNTTHNMCLLKCSPSNIGILASEYVVDTILNIFNLGSAPYDAMVLWAMSMRCDEWQPRLPLMPLGLSGDGAKL